MSKVTALYSFPLRLGVPGVGMTAWHQVVGLRDQGVRVMLYAGSCEKAVDGLHGLRETLVPCGAKLPISLLGIRGAAALHDRIVAKVLTGLQKKQEIDVVHCWPLGAEQTLRTARQLGIKTVLERPNTHTRYAYEVVRDECRKLGIKLSKSHSHHYNVKRLRREEREYELADLLLCPSDFVARTCRAKGISNRKTVRHQYGFDPEEFTVPSSDTRRNDRRFKMAFLGRCEPRKGLHYALEAWLASEACKTGTFYICGEYIPGYRDLLAGKLSHPSVEEVGFLSEPRSLLQKCHALVLPSIEEGSALVTYEARACGCVLLVSEAAGAHCTHMQDALVHKVGHAASLREHIDLLAGSEAFFKKLQVKSLAGLESLTWQKAAEVLVDIYRHAPQGKS